MMSLYASRSFAKDRFQWAKCVVQYMCDGVHPNVTHLVVLLAEVVSLSLVQNIPMTNECYRDQTRK